MLLVWLFAMARKGWWLAEEAAWAGEAGVRAAGAPG